MVGSKNSDNKLNVTGNVNVDGDCKLWCDVDGDVNVGGDLVLGGNVSGELNVGGRITNK